MIHISLDGKVDIIVGTHCQRQCRFNVLRAKDVAALKVGFIYHVYIFLSALSFGKQDCRNVFLHAVMCRWAHKADLDKHFLMIDLYHA